MNKNKRSSWSVSIGGGFILALVALATALTDGCRTTQTVDPITGVTNIVTTIDQNKLSAVDATVSAVGSGIFRRAILRSPEHAAEISAYVRAVGGVFCTMKTTGQFSPDLLIIAADQATVGLQGNVPPEVVDGKNALESLYRILFNDQLTVTVPNNGWPSAVATIVCDAVNKSLVDSGQPGLPRTR